MAAPGQGGDLLDRCSLEIRAPEGGRLGTGVLLDPRRVLTCSHVIGELDRVELHDGQSAERLTGAEVARRGKPDAADDLALLELDAPLPGRGAIRFAQWERGDRFGTVGFPKWGKDHVRGRVLGESAHRGWLQVDVDGSRKLEPGFSGGAVWVPAKHAAVGLITQGDGDGAALAVPSRQIRDFWPELRDATRVAGYLKRVGRLLGVPDVEAAVTGADPEGAWRQAADLGAASLAEELCLETEPDALARGLSAAYCRLARKRRSKTGEQVWQVLLEALPAALLSRWQIEVPESAAPEVRLQVIGRVLAEFALAAAEDGAAGFHRRPGRKDSDIPWATHRVPRPGELGADPEGKEAAAELAEEVGERLALGSGLEDGSPIDKSFLGVLAARRHAGEGPLLLDRGEIEEYRGMPALPAPPRL